MKDLESFQSFLYCHFKDTPYYKQMLPLPQQSANFLRKQEHKFNNLNDINVSNLKLQPIIVQMRKCYSRKGKVNQNI